MTKIKKIIMLVFCVVLLQISVVAAQPQPNADANASPDSELDPTTVNLLQNGQESDADNVKIEVSELSLRGKVLFLIQEARLRGEKPIVSEDEIDNLSDEELERLINKAFSQEEADSETGEHTANLEGTQQEKGTDDEEESLSSRVIEFLQEHEEEALGGSLLLGAAGAAGYGHKKLYGSEDENEAEGDEEVEEEDNYESYRDTKTASTDPKDSFFSLGGVAEAGKRYGGGGGDLDTGVSIPQADESADDVGFMLSESDRNNTSSINNPEKLWNELKVKGFSNEGAAGILGNFAVESGCNPTHAEVFEGEDWDTIQETYAFEIDDERGYGYAQWTEKSRKAGLQNMANSMNSSVSDSNVQVEYLMEEMANKSVSLETCLRWEYNIDDGICSKYHGEKLLDVIRQCENCAEATTIFHDIFERSGDYDSEEYGHSINHRIEKAETFLRKFGNASH